jgi:hypothetical protein
MDGPLDKKAMDVDDGVGGEHLEDEKFGRPTFIFLSTAGDIVRPFVCLSWCTIGGDLLETPLNCFLTGS